MRLARWMLYLFVFGLGVAAGTYLLIRVSLFSSGTTVPPVVGLSKEQAQWQAQRAHLVFKVLSERYDLHQKKNRVIEQSPAPGMSARKGMTLSAVVSKGIETVTMPDLVGMRMEEAQLQAQQAGLQLNATSYYHGVTSAPLVASQNPPAGTIVPRDSEVSLLVDLGGPSPVFVMPNLYGYRYEDVRKDLKLYAISVGPARAVGGGGVPPGTIVGQIPDAGRPLGRNDLVQLMVSR